MPTTIYFTADPDSLRTTYKKEIGEPINLNDLFDSVSKTENKEKEEVPLESCKSSNQDIQESSILNDLLNCSSNVNRR